MAIIPTHVDAYMQQNKSVSGVASVDYTSINVLRKNYKEALENCKLAYANAKANLEDDEAGADARLWLRVYKGSVNDLKLVDKKFQAEDLSYIPKELHLNVL